MYEIIASPDIEHMVPLREPDLALEHLLSRVKRNERPHVVGGELERVAVGASPSTAQVLAVVAPDNANQWPCLGSGGGGAGEGTLRGKCAKRVQCCACCICD